MASSPLAQFLKWEKQKPNALFFRQPIDGLWKTWTYQQAGDEIRRIAAGLQAQNYPVGSNIALLAKNCAHWIMGDLAIMMAGHVTVPIYATLTGPSIRQILDHAQPKAIFIGKLDDYPSQKSGIPDSILKIGVSLYGINEKYLWEDWTKTYPPTNSIYDWKPEDLLTIIYTSGTTGQSKGVMHTVDSVDSTVTAAITELGLPSEPQLFSYLPLCHIAERAGIEIIGLYSGATFSFAETLETFPKNLADTQPHNFFAVPRIWAKFKEKIQEKLPEEKLNRLLKIPIVSSIVKRSIKKKLGLSRAKFIFTGAAPITVDLLKWFLKLDIEILQAYGMTEDCVYAHFNRHGANRLGTVGTPLKGLFAKIAEDGEIRVKSKGLTKGYYKEPELTAKLFDEEGYLKTGDQGEISSDKYLTITGRLKDQFKTDKGKYISPAPIEMKLLESTDVEQVCVVGMGVPAPIALVVLSEDARKKSKNEIIDSITQLLNSVNASIESFEQLATAVIMKNSWTIENGLMTPTLKTKRNEVEKIHLPNYPKWYYEEGVVVWE